jgi:uncharacterized protein (TIGR03118 family)
MQKCVAVMSLVMVVLIVGIYGCSKNATEPLMPAAGALGKAQAVFGHPAASGMQVNLVSNSNVYSPARTDGSLLNAWGIAFTPTGRIWISGNHSGVSVVYDTNGNQVRTPVTIPSKDSGGTGAPTGVVFNPTTGFVIPQSGEVSRFIFASEDGIITAWASGGSAMIVADRSDSDAVYKGLTMAQDGGRTFLYATNFKGGMVDVFDDHFRLVTTKPFTDPNIPAGFAPFNIQNIDGMLFVTYAKHLGPDNQDDQSGPGNGFIDIYRTDGSLARRFASQGALNSPWGITETPGNGDGRSEHKILVGNFGDGRINMFDSHGRFIGALSDTSGNPVMIQGLWALSFGNAAASGGDHQGDDGGNEGDGGDKGDGHGGDHHGDGDHHEVDKDSVQHAVRALDDARGKTLPRLFFTAGPNGEEDGIFGYLQLQK